jgi:MFS family permease
MDLFKESLRRLNVITHFRELSTTRQRRDSLIALASTQLLVQLSSMPIAMTIPSVARHFDVAISEAAWMVVIRLLMLGSTVFLAARLGEKFGYTRVYFIGAILMTLASVLSATSNSLITLILWSGVVGIGGALITGNANAILATVFDQTERGRAFSVQVISARIGTLIGLAVFGLLLTFFISWGWRLVFLTSLPIGLLAMKNSFPLLKYQAEQLKDAARNISINYIAAILMVATLGTLILSGLHIHEGSETFTSSEALAYHVPMHALFLALLVLFIVVQSRTGEPFVQFGYFKKKPFSMALYSNTTFHLSMLAVTTLIPIVVEKGLGYSPLVVALVLIPNQLFGLFLPALAGWVYDKYDPRWLRPSSLMGIALGFVLVGFFAGAVPVWGIPLLMLPAYIGSNLFNTANNALVMNTLPESTSFASGMLETTRQMGHTIGATISAAVIAIAIPVTIEFLSPSDLQAVYREGFRYAAIAVVWIMISGSVVAIFQKMPDSMRKDKNTPPTVQPAPGD